MVCPLFESDKERRHMSENPDLFNNPRFITSPLHKVHALCNIRSVSSSRCRFKEKRSKRARCPSTSHHFPKNSISVLPKMQPRF